MRRTAWARPLAGALVLLLGLTLVAAPAAAAPQTAAPVKPTLVAAARAQVAAMNVPPRALAQVGASQGASQSEGRSFLKSPAGVVAVVLMTAGTGFMVYSAFHDNNPVHSPIR